MSRRGPHGPKQNGEADDHGKALGREADPLPASARRTLDEIARALQVTTSLLRQEIGSEGPSEGMAGLGETSALLQAFVRIADPEARRRCLAFVNAEAAKGQGGE